MTALIRPCHDGRFQLLSEFEPGAVDAELILVREIVLDPMEQLGEVYDTVAFDPSRPTRWWTESGLATCLGEYELDTAWWDDRPARMVATPADWLACHGAAFVILDWSCDLSALLGRAPTIECADDWLAGKLNREMAAQARPNIQIFAKGGCRAAAA